MSKIIFLHGTSSSGKSTLAKAIQVKIGIPFWHFASDQLIEAGMLPKRVKGGDFDWALRRPLFFDAFHGCIKAILDAGNNVILDHIIESKEWYQDLQSQFKSHDVFFVGIHCPLSVLREREMSRNDKDVGNRYSGEAEYHLRHVHSYSKYDFEIDSSEQPTERTAELIIEAWRSRSSSHFLCY